MENASGMQCRRDPRHFGDHAPFQRLKGPRVELFDQSRQQLVDGFAPGQLGDHDKALQVGPGPMRSPAATTSGTSIPSARACSR